MRYLGVYIAQGGLGLVAIGSLGFAVTGSSRFEPVAVAGIVVGFFGAAVFALQQFINS